MMSPKSILTSSKPTYLILSFVCNTTASTETHTLSLHDALPIFGAATGAPLDVYTGSLPGLNGGPSGTGWSNNQRPNRTGDRKSTRLNSSHGYNSYAVFCLKKNNETSTMKIFRRRREHSECITPA